MLNQLRNSKAFHLFWGFIALLFLNLSIDLDDQSPEYIAEDLSYNKQESIVELVLEKFLGFENAIAEYDEQDSEEQTKTKTVKLDFFSEVSVNYYFSDKPFVNTNKPRYLVDNAFLTAGFYQRETPPPKA